MWFGLPNTDSTDLLTGFIHHRMAEAGRTLWRLSSPPPSSEEGQLEQLGFEYLQG